MIQLPSLEKTFKKTKPIVLAIDLRIYVNLLLNSYPATQETWRTFFANIAGKYKPDSLIVVDDCRDENYEYWRHKVLRDLGLPEYKGNRVSNSTNQTRPPDYVSHYNIALEVIKDLNISYFAKPGVEADDFIGLASRAKRYLDNNFELWVCSFDADLMQLVSDKWNIKLFSSGRFKKRSELFDELEVIEYYRSKGIKIAKPADIVRYKIKYGDRGDNLIPGSPARVIDLSVAHHDLFNDNDFDRIRKAISVPLN
jgi:5'-3' exonuclease